MTAIRRVLQLRLTGLVAVHAARAAHTALGSVAGVISATVSLAGAEVDFEGPFEAEPFAAAVRVALAPLGMGLTSVTVVQDRALPQL